MVKLFNRPFPENPKTGKTPRAFDIKVVFFLIPYQLRGLDMIYWYMYREYRRIVNISFTERNDKWNREKYIIHIVYLLHMYNTNNYSWYSQGNECTTICLYTVFGERGMQISPQPCAQSNKAKLQTHFLYILQMLPVKRVSLIVEIILSQISNNYTQVPTCTDGTSHLMNSHSPLFHFFFF